MIPPTSDEGEMHLNICAISDLHGYLPFRVPECDLLLIGGDLCPDRLDGHMAWHAPHRQAEWFETKFVPWLNSQPAKASMVTWGNHDFCGRGTDLPPVIVDKIARFRDVSVWLSPWSRTFGAWTFMKSEDELAKVYAQIPEGTDIIVSHQPPFGYVDQAFPPDSPHLGSTALLAAIERVKPRVVICGHIHGGFGRYKHNDTDIYNVSVVDEGYRLVNPPTVFELEPLS